MNIEKPQPTAEDWIIARLIHFALNNATKQAAVNNDVVNAAAHLCRKVGMFQIGVMGDVLRAEKGE